MEFKRGWLQRRKEALANSLPREEGSRDEKAIVGQTTESSGVPITRMLAVANSETLDSGQSERWSYRLGPTRKLVKCLLRVV